MSFVAVKTEDQQVRGMLFRTRDLLVRQHTQTVIRPAGSTLIDKTTSLICSCSRGHEPTPNNSRPPSRGPKPRHDTGTLGPRPRPSGSPRPGAPPCRPGTTPTATPARRCSRRSRNCGPGARTPNAPNPTSRTAPPRPAPARRRPLRARPSRPHPPPPGPAPFARPPAGPVPIVSFHVSFLPIPLPPGQRPGLAARPTPEPVLLRRLPVQPVRQRLQPRRVLGIHHRRAERRSQRPV